ncbi:hypothetical protein JCM6882_009403 [Rhodosporidiobolus microsporus]
MTHSHEHHGILDKVKHALGADEETKSPERLEDEKHAAMNRHNAEEARADALIQQREASERAHPERSGPPDVVPVAARHELSSMPHRASLEEAAEGHSAGKVTQPDLEGVTHIPESQLPPRLPRMENTGLRPSDPNDPNSMNGLPTGTVAGDDRML